MQDETSGALSLMNFKDEKDEIDQKKIERSQPISPRLENKDMVEQHRKYIEDWFQINYGSITEANRGTARFNSIDAPMRVEKIFSEIHGKLSGLDEIRILDVGCGFGGMALALASKYPKAYVDAIDVSDRFYSVAKKTVSIRGLTRVNFRTCNLLELNDVDSYECVLLCGVLNYLRTKEELENGCVNVWRSLCKGGWLVVHTPHFWTWREPFTRLPLVHILPRSIQEEVAKRIGKRDTLIDIRLPRVGELKRIFQRLGRQNCLIKPKGFAPRFLQSHVTMWIKK